MSDKIRDSIRKAYNQTMSKEDKDQVKNMMITNSLRAMVTLLDTLMMEDVTLDQEAMRMIKMTLYRANKILYKNIVKEALNEQRNNC